MVSSSVRKQHLSMVAVMTILASAPSVAQDVTIDSEQTTPVVSSTNGGSNGGTITITENGSVTVSSGTAVTINNPYAFIMEATSSISSEDLLEGRGLFLDASTEQLIGDLELAGSITVGNDDAAGFDIDTSSDNIGLLLDGEFGFEGDILLDSTGSITVFGSDGRGVAIDTIMNGNLTIDGAIASLGDRVIGVDINAAMTGDLTIGGAITAFDPDTIGVRIGETLDGALTHRGSISVGEGEITDDDGNVTPAQPAIAGLLIEADITGGVLIDGFGANNDLDLDGDGNDDITSDATISTTGGGPAVLIRTQESATEGLTLGTVGDTGYGYVQRGNLSSLSGSNGIGTTAFQIIGRGNAPVTIEGGIYMDFGAVVSRATDADAIGIEIGNYVNVPTFLNTGTIDVDTFASSTVDDMGTDDSNDDETIVGPGGDAVALLLRENANLPVFNNDGVVGATARGDGKSATAILDQSGQLTHIINTGSIGAATEDENASAIAIDLRANTSGVTLENSGLILGDVYLGSGDDSVTFSNGDVLGDLYFGTGSDTLTLTGEANFSGSVDFDGTLALAVDGSDLTLGSSDMLHFSSASFTNEANLIFNLDPENDEAGLLEIDGTLSIAKDVNVQPVFSSFSDEEKSYEIIRAGSFDFADSGASLELSNTPYFFNVALNEGTDGAVNTLTIDVSRKTADQLEVSESMQSLYENITTTGFEMDSPLETSLAGIVGQEDAEAALTALMPDVTNVSFNAALSAERQFANHLANRLTDFMSERNSFEGGAWVREVTHFGDHTPSNSLLNSNVLTVGLTAGYDVPISDHFAWGFNTGFTLNGFSGKDDTLQTEFSSFAPFLSLYTMGRVGPFYMGLQATGQYADIERERTIEFGSVSRIVDSTTTAWNLVGTAEVGLDLNLGGLHFVPFGRLSAQKYSESGYTEDGGDSANLTVGSRSFGRTQAGFGGSLGYDFKWKRPRETKIFRPEIFYSYAKTISGADPAALDAIFVAGDTNFALEIDQMAESVEQYGGAFNLFGDGSKARVNYAYEKLDDIKAHAVTVNFALTF